MSTRLRWEQRDTGTWWGHSGDLTVAMVLKPRAGRYEGRWQWEILAVQTRRIVDGSGARKSAYEAKGAAEKAWAKWLDHAALQPKAA